LLGTMALVVLGIAVVAALWPRAIAWPLALIGAWLAMSWLLKTLSLLRGARRGPEIAAKPDAVPDGRIGGDGRGT
jgi:cardiolipin synthase